MMTGLFVFLQKVRAAQPDPSTLTAAWENIFLNRSIEPYSSSITFAIVFDGFPPPPLFWGARFCQNSEWSRCPPM
jgi:hypothetical protein